MIGPPEEGLSLMIGIFGEDGTDGTSRCRTEAECALVLEVKGEGFFGPDFDPSPSAAIGRLEAIGDLGVSSFKTPDSGTAASC